jgi:hypothetical protein
VLLLQRLLLALPLLVLQLLMTRVRASPPWLCELQLLAADDDLEQGSCLAGAAHCCCFTIVAHSWESSAWSAPSLHSWESSAPARCRCCLWDVMGVGGKSGVSISTGGGPVAVRRLAGSRPTRCECGGRATAASRSPPGGWLLSPSPLRHQQHVETQAGHLPMRAMRAGETPLTILSSVGWPPASFTS